MQKGLSSCIAISAQNQTQGGKRVVYNKWAKIERDCMELFSTLKETYGDMLRQVLEYIDQELAKHRDKNRYCLKDKQTVLIPDVI